MAAQSKHKKAFGEEKSQEKKRMERNPAGKRCPAGTKTMKTDIVRSREEKEPGKKAEGKEPITVETGNSSRQWQRATGSSRRQTAAADNREKVADSRQQQREQQNQEQRRREWR